MFSRLVSARRSFQLKTYHQSFTKALSTRTEFSHRTGNNVIKGNQNLEYPIDDCFTFFSKKLELFGDAVAMVNHYSNLNMIVFI